MSSRRSISWSSAQRDLRADRTVVPAGLLAIRGLIEAGTRYRPLVVLGTYDRAAIMIAAVAAAKAHVARYGSTWGAAMSIALKAAWQTARKARPVAALSH